MRVEIIRHEPLLKRVPTMIDRTENIQAYDSDNLYPQRAKEVRNRSYTTKIATERLAGFLVGGGFADPLLSSLVVNKKRQTMNDILGFMADDESIYDGRALLINYNLNYKISSVKQVYFEYVRMGLPDEMGEYYDLKFSNNWEQDPYKNIEYTRKIYTYYKFNPDPNVVKQEIEECGGIMNYPGQIWYMTPRENEYPLCTFDAVFDYAQVQSELGVFDVSAIQNGWSATSFFKYPGSFENKEDKQEFQKSLDGFKGAKGANSTMVVENPGGGDLNLIETISLPNVDRLHEVTKQTAKDSIRENFAMAMEILGVAPTSGMFNRQQIQEAYEFFNTITEKRRARISRDVRQIFENWYMPLNISTFDITPKVYGQVTNKPGTPQTVPANSGVQR